MTKRMFQSGTVAGCLQTLPLQANITVHGSSTEYQETGGDWQSMGTNDIDGSGGFGTDGYIFFGNFNR